MLLVDVLHYCKLKITFALQIEVLQRYVQVKNIDVCEVSR